MKAFFKDYNWWIIISCVLFAIISTSIVSFLKFDSYSNLINLFFSFISLTSLFISCKAIVDINRVIAQVKLEEELNTMISNSKEMEQQLFYREFENNIKITIEQFASKLEIIIRGDTKEFSEDFFNKISSDAWECYKIINKYKYVKLWLHKPNMILGNMRVDKDVINEEMDLTRLKFKESDIKQLLINLEKIHKYCKCEVNEYKNTYLQLEDYKEICEVIHNEVKQKIDKYNYYLNPSLNQESEYE